MTVTLQSIGAWLGGTTSVTPVIPSHAAGDMLVCAVFAKPTATGTPPVMGTPAGWTITAVLQSNGSGVAQAADAGQVWCIVYHREATSGAETNPTVTVTNGNVCMGSVNVWRKTLPTWNAPTAAVGSDTTSATSWSTGHGSGFQTRDGYGIDYRAALAGDNAAFPASPGSIALSGATFVALTHGTPSSTALGNQMAAVNYNWIATGNVNTATLTVTATLTAAQTGVAFLIRIREAGSQPPPHPFRRLAHIIGR